MINKISTTNQAFKGYKQNFSDEEFKKSLHSSLSWAKENIDHTKYFTTKKRMGKKLDKNALGGTNLLETYRNIFKKADIEPVVELSLDKRELVGKVNYYHSKPIEIRTEMPMNFNNFFKRLLVATKAKMQEENIKTKLWHLQEEEKYLEALQNRRFKELTPENQTPNPIIIGFDSKYTNLVEKLLKLTVKKNELLESLNKLKPKLENKQFKLKIK